MNFLKNLLGKRPADKATPAASGRPRSVAAELQNVWMEDIPSEWTAFRSRQHLFEIPYPASWSLDERRDSIIIRPSHSRTLLEEEKLMFSPGFTFMAGVGASFSDDALLDAYLANMSERFESFRRRESEKITLNGVRTLAVFYDFARSSGTWSCLATVRAKGDSFWYLAASGHTDDIASLRPQLVPVLANVRLYSSEADFEAATRRDCPPPVLDTLPEGNSVGLLFEIGKCSGSFYSRVFESDFFGRLDMQRLAGTRVFVGDILPECRYYCIRVDGPTDVIRYIREVFVNVTDIDALPDGAHRFMSGSVLQSAPLVSKGYVDQTGCIV